MSSALRPTWTAARSARAATPVECPRKIGHLEIGEDRQRARDVVDAMLVGAGDGPGSRVEESIEDPRVLDRREQLCAARDEYLRQACLVRADDRATDGRDGRVTPVLLVRRLPDTIRCGCSCGAVPAAAARPQAVM